MERTLRLGKLQVERDGLAEICRRYQVRELSVFGSAAHGSDRPDSDVDLLVDYLPQAPVDLVEFNSLMLDLSRFLGRNVDLVSKGGLKPRIRASVLAEALPLYAA